VCSLKSEHAWFGFSGLTLETSDLKLSSNWVRFARFTPRPSHGPHEDCLCPHTPSPLSLASFCAFTFRDSPAAGRNWVRFAQFPPAYPCGETGNGTTESWDDGQVGQRLTHASPGFAGRVVPTIRLPRPTGCLLHIRHSHPLNIPTVTGPRPRAGGLSLRTPRVASPDALLRREGHVIHHAATVPHISMYSKRKPSFCQAKDAPETAI
jgi:hypothetical protein